VNYNWNWGILFTPSAEGHATYLHMLLAGLGWTAVTTFAAWTLAVVFGSLVGVARTLPSVVAQRLAAAYVELFRNVPLLVQLFLWYFVLPDLLPAAWGRWMKQMPNAPFFTAVVGIGFYMSARVAEQVRAGINTLSRGQRRAGLAVGLTLAQTYRYVLMPMAYRISLPPLTSEFLNTVKNTSVALTIGLAELTARARSMQEFTFQVFEAFATATVIYLVFSLLIVAVMRRVERRVALQGYSAGGR
jgi:glutamate/aspartate transport system permease protein